MFCCCRALARGPLTSRTCHLSSDSSRCDHCEKSRRLDSLDFLNKVRDVGCTRNCRWLHLLDSSGDGSKFGVLAPGANVKQIRVCSLSAVLCVIFIFCCNAVALCSILFGRARSRLRLRRQSGISVFVGHLFQRRRVNVVARYCPCKNCNDKLSLHSRTGPLEVAWFKAIQSFDAMF